jgi:hypothetical protein
VRRRLDSRFDSRAEDFVELDELSDYLLTRDRFEELDFCEATLNLNFEALHSPIVQLASWGIVFHFNHHPMPPEVQLHDSIRSLDLAYLPSWSVVTFTGVKKVEIEVAPYMPSLDGKADFLGECGQSRGTDDIMRLSKAWECPGRGAEAYTYGFDSVLEHPYGYCSLKIHATGPVNLAFRADLLIPLADFIANPKKWNKRSRLPRFN